MVSSKSFHVVRVFIGTRFNFLPHSNIRNISVMIVSTKDVYSQAPKFLLSLALDVATFDPPQVFRLDVGIIPTENGPISEFAANFVVRANKFPNRRRSGGILSIVVLVVTLKSDARRKKS